MFSISVYCRQPALYREIGNLFSLRIEDGTIQRENCFSSPLGRQSKCSLNILGTYYVNVLKLNPKHSCGQFDLFYRLWVGRFVGVFKNRSEERRVGKECRSR